MNKLFKVVPYSMTRGCNQYKNYVDSPFSHNLLESISDNGIFDGWKYKDLVSWSRYTNEDNVMLEFYIDYYVIKVKNNEFRLPIPNTINEFIIDMYRLNINLYWLNKINWMFEPKDVLCTQDIKEYYVNILAKMEKSFELI